MRWRDEGRDRGKGERLSLPVVDPQRGICRDEPWWGERLCVPGEAWADVELGEEAAAYAVAESWWKAGLDHLVRSTPAQWTGVGVEEVVVVGSKVPVRGGDGDEAP